VPHQIPKPAGEALLEVRALAGGAVGRASFTLGKGEIVGLAGLAGAGQSELLRLLIGAEPARSGVIRLAGRKFRAGNPAAAWAAGLAYVPRERRTEGLLLSR